MDIYSVEVVDILIMGDMNINWADIRNANRKKYANPLKVLNLEQFLKMPRRFTNRSSTIIDHVITNRPDLYLSANTIGCGVIDHALVYTNRKKAKILQSFTYI